MTPRACWTLSVGRQCAGVRVITVDTDTSQPRGAMYRAMVLTRTFDAKAVAMQRTGRLGTDSTRRATRRG